jgi:hypothetical protein
MLPVPTRRHANSTSPGDSVNCRSTIRRQATRPRWSHPRRGGRDLVSTVLAEVDHLEVEAIGLRRHDGSQDARALLRAHDPTHSRDLVRLPGPPRRRR